MKRWICIKFTIYVILREVYDRKLSIVGTFEDQNCKFLVVSK